MTQKPIEKYTALVMQPHVEVATDRSGIERNLQKALDLIDFGVGYYWEVPVRLAVFPEYFLVLLAYRLEGVSIARASCGRMLLYSYLNESKVF